MAAADSSTRASLFPLKWRHAHRSLCLGTRKAIPAPGTRSLPPACPRVRAFSILADGSQHGETCILRFHAGPPYEDIAFKIVNKEWEYAPKRGFRCSFERGILHLYINLCGPLSPPLWPSDHRPSALCSAPMRRYGGVRPLRIAPTRAFCSAPPHSRPCAIAAWTPHKSAAASVGVTP